MTARSTLTTLCLLFLALIAGVCSYGSPPSSTEQAPRTLILENRNWQTAAIYVLCNHSLPKRVSQLETYERREVKVRKTPCDTLTIRVELSPSGAVYWAPPITINPGRCMRFVVQNNFGTSAWGPCRRA